MVWMVLFCGVDGILVSVLTNIADPINRLTLGKWCPFQTNRHSLPGSVCSLHQFSCEVTVFILVPIYVWNIRAQRTKLVWCTLRRYRSSMPQRRSWHHEKSPRSNKYVHVNAFWKQGCVDYVWKRKADHISVGLCSCNWLLAGSSWQLSGYSGVCHD